MFSSAHPALSRHRVAVIERASYRSTLSNASCDLYRPLRSEERKTLKVRLLPESQGQNLALALLCVPSSLDRGVWVGNSVGNSGAVGNSDVW